MGAPSLSSAWDRCLDILSSVRDATTNVILVSLGNVVGKTQESDNAEWWQHVGFASRASKPEAGVVAAQCVILRGSPDCVIASRDTRCTSLYSQLDYGETCVFAGGEDGTAQGRILLKKTGAVAIYTREGNTPTGNGMTISVDPATNTISLLNGAGHGILINDDGVFLTAKDSGLQLLADGNVKLVGKQQTQVDGATVLLGSVAIPVVNAALKGPAGLVAVPSVKVLIE